MPTLTAGQRLGAYEIVAPIGAGGMGEVYRAHDTRLNRPVAIKVLPASIAGSPDALARFEREARAVAAISHPNILAIYDFGQSSEVTYAVMELLEGQTLRERLSTGALPPRKAVEVGVQITRGLAAAHDRHIVHRDLKPENVFLTTDSIVKVLDFGLARTVPAATASAAIDSPTVATEPGTVLGSVGYMAPEQVRGENADHRADLFALGCVLFEMLTGRRAFSRDTAAETMTAILREDPPELPSGIAALPTAVARTVRRCLEKRPEERFQSARDLAFALETSLDASSTVPGALPAGRTRTPWYRSRWLLLAAGAVIGAAAVWLAVARQGTAPAAAPTFRRLTFDRGTVREARFGPDGRTVVYGAAWEGDPIRTFMTRTDTTETVRVNIPDAQVLSVSRAGEMAISLGHAFEGWMGVGTLARASMLGGAPRPMIEHVREAEWTPDGSDLAIVRRAAGFERLEFPVGRVLYQTSGYVSNIRFSPSGDRIAFADHPFFADDSGGVSVVDRQGTRTVVAEGFNSVRGVAWSPDGREVWYSAVTGETGSSYMFAAPLSGGRRVVYNGPTQLRLFDIAADGRVLLGNDVSDRRVEALLAGDTTVRDISLRDASAAFWVAPDGRAVTLADQAVAGYAAYLFRVGATGPVRLGRGQAYGMSSDGRWIAALPANEPRVLLHSPGAAESVELPNPDRLFIDALGWLPDGSGLVLFGQPGGRLSRGYVQRLSGGPPRPFTPEGVGAIKWWSLAVSPEGSRVLARDIEGRIARYPIEGDGTPEPVTGLEPGDVPASWTSDGRALLVARGYGRPWIVERMDLATGRREKVFEVRPREGAGLRLSFLALSPDGHFYVHTYSRLLSALYVVEGLR